MSGRALAVVLGLVVLAGLAPLRASVALVTGLGLLAGQPSGPLAMAVGVLAGLLLFLPPALPLLAAGGVALRGWHLPRGLAVGLAVAAGLLGALLSLLAAGINPPVSQPLVLVKGAAFTLSAVGAVLLLAAPRAGLAALALPLAVAIWSLGSGVMVARQAVTLAAGQPYCLAAHGGPAFASLADLRGAALFTERGGFKSTSNWYFHAVLIVADPAGVRLYNWSHRARAFAPISAETDSRLIAPVHASCTPRAGFLRGLPLW